MQCRVSNNLLVIFAVLILFVVLVGCSRKGSESPQPDNTGAVPAADSLSSDSGWPADLLVIYGSGFGDTLDLTRTVLFDGDTAEVHSWTDSLISARIPNRPGESSVFACRKDTCSNALPFLVYGITLVEPDSAFIGDTVFIHGSGFGVSQDSSAVSVGELNGSVLLWSDELVAVMFGEAAAPGLLALTVDDHTCEWGPFAVIAALFITEIIPDLACIGDTVTIVGTGFGDGSDGRLLLDGVEIAACAWEDGMIRAVIPEGAVTGLLQVEKQLVLSNQVQLNVVSCPIIQEVVPDLACNGDTVTIVGTEFGDGPDGRLLLNGTEIATCDWETGIIKAVIPEDAVSGFLQVERQLVSSNPVLLSVLVCDGVLAVLQRTNYVRITLTGHICFSGDNCNYTTHCLSNGHPCLWGAWGDCNDLYPLNWGANSFSVDSQFTENDWFCCKIRVSGSVSEDGSALTSIYASRTVGNCIICEAISAYRKDGCFSIRDLALISVDSSAMQVVYGAVGEAAGESTDSVRYSWWWCEDFWGDWPGALHYISTDWNHPVQPAQLQVVFELR